MTKSSEPRLVKLFIDQIAGKLVLLHVPGQVAYRLCDSSVHVHVNDNLVLPQRLCRLAGDSPSPKS